MAVQCVMNDDADADDAEITVTLCLEQHPPPLHPG